MNPRSNPLVWSFSLGTWFDTRVRVSWFVPVLIAWALFKFGWQMGAAISAICFVTILLHEFSHMAVARATGVGGDEILIWPLGGLAFVGTGASPRNQILISMAGPLFHVVVCLALLYTVLTSGLVGASLTPFVLPVAQEDFGKSLLLDLGLLTFNLNFALLLLNLIPAMPLDGGQALRSALSLRMGSLLGTEASIRLAFIVGLVLALVAMLVLNNTFLLGLAFFLIIYAVLENVQVQTQETADDSFMGYDFSQGYTSLERSEVPSEPPPKAPGFFERWKKRREEARARREAEQQQAAAQQLDALLAKVHEHGLQSLSESEKRILKQASDRLRSKGPKDQPEG